MQASGSGSRNRNEDGDGVPHEITLSDEVRQYLGAQSGDFRVCTSCGGPILLPISVKHPKSTDIRIPVGNRTLYISRYQAPFLDLIDRDMIPRYLLHGHEY
ncbi:MAG: hypothetical protein LUO93_05310 [Methanomicrobiales archaeon]|nr:hypothetical protein [Methanomicrobiales archaeon]